MENDNISDVSTGNNNDITNDSNIINDVSGIETQVYYDYDYRNYLQTIINNQEMQIKVLNEGFTFISFLLCIAGTYMLFKNFIRK